VRKRGILFDFDYTLADSSRGVCECIFYAFSKLGLQQPNREQILMTIGLPLSDTFRLLSRIDDEKLEKKFNILFVQKADEVMADLTCVYYDVRETLSYLKDEKNIILGIVSTKFRYRIEAILQRERLLQIFEVIIGGEDVDNHKPDPEGILKAIAQINLSIADAVFIGDSLVDLCTARNANIDFIPCLNGRTTADQFKQEGFSKYIHKISDIKNIF
jgi:phosphoglycolate phosphatase